MTRRLRRVPVTRVGDDGSSAGYDDVVVEEPLSIRIGGRTLAITMRTPGDDFDLVAGFCLTEGVLAAGATVREMRYCTDVESFNTIDVDLDGEPVWHERSLVASAACGVCGKTAIDDVRRRLPPVAPSPPFAIACVAAAPERLRSAQPTFQRTGGLHAAGLMARDGKWECVREDVGRHNAVDKVIGWALLADRVPLRDSALVVSGRAGFEIVQKALAAGLPVLAAVGAPTTLAIDLANGGGMGLAGFVRNGRMTIYAGAERFERPRSSG